jgi:diguanylate cyclase (GGDEF)-like protein
MPPATTSMTVLLVDGVVSYRKKVASLLGEMGYGVTETGDAVQAERAMARGSFDVAVIDQELPDRSGIDLVAQLKELGRATKLMLIVATGADVGGLDDLCRASGCSVAVRGPLHPDALVQHVDRLANGLLSEIPHTADEAERASRTTVPGIGYDEVQLKEIRRAYQVTLPEKLAELKQLAQHAREHWEDKEALRQLHRRAHTLYGTAGTMGFTEIGTAASEIEQAAKRCLSGTTPDEQLWSEVFDAIRRAENAPQKLSSIPPPTARFGGVSSVLVIDDDTDMIAAVTALGRRNLINVIGATNREESLEQMAAIRFDGVIIDINLGPGESSFELAQELRSLEGHADLPIAFMSADGSVPNRVAAASAGASVFLKKPLDPDELNEAVRGFSAARTSTSPRVLLVDDDDFFRQRIAQILEQEGMDVTSLGDPERALDVTAEVKPDLILLDVNMPGVDGHDVCRMLRSTSAWRELPILFLTGELGPEARVECFSAGGDDYIEKPVIREELLARISVRLERMRLFRDRADRDALTGLPNRRAFLDLFKLRIADGQRYDTPVSLCVLDLDHFKRINDDHGHLAGDRVLASLGKLLAARFRTVDVRGRWGGEEFAVAFYGEDKKTARKITERVLHDFGEMSFVGDDNQTFQVTFSAGVATFPEDGATFDELFRVADQRLYEAKETGRNRVR